MKRLRPAAALLAGLLLPLALPAPSTAALPALSTAAPAADAPAAAVTAGPGAEKPDLTSANRTSPPAGMPDWSRVGFRGGRPLPGGGDLTGNAACRITPDRLASQYGVRADDGADDTTGPQKAVDDIKAACSPDANFDSLSLISLPAGRIDVSRQIYVDADYLVLRGQGSGTGGTRLVFRPDADTRYDTLVNGRWDQDSLKAGSDVGTGGWIRPGRGMFRVQTRDIAERYQDDWAAAPANRKDIFERSVNQHWASGIKVAAKAADGRIVLAVDVSNWLRPDAPTSDDRLFCHVHGRGDRKTDELVPGWPYSFVAALETGRTSWVALLDAVRLGPADDATAVTAAQLRDVVERLKQAEQWQPGDPEILIMTDSGYDVAYLSHALVDLPIMLVGRLRSDRVMLRDAGPARSTPKGGHPRRHGGVLTFTKPESTKPESWHRPEVTTVTDTTRYGTAEAIA